MAKRVSASLAELLVAASRQPDLARSVAELANQCGLGMRAFQKRCKRAGTKAKRCLNFLRCLRVVETRRRHWDPRGELGWYITDDRTIRPIERQGGLNRPTQPTVPQYFEHQKFLPLRLCKEVHRELRRHAQRASASSLRAATGQGVPDLHGHRRS